MNNVSRQKEKIIIADTQFLIVEGLKASLRDKYDIAGVATSQAQLFAELEKVNPALLILDIYLPDLDGINDLSGIRQKYPGLGIIILTNNIARKDLQEYHKSGIHNILHKTAEHDELLDCIESAIKGKKYYSGMVLDLLLEADLQKIHFLPAHLTASEIDIVRLIAEGLTNKEIAAKKILSIHTIMTHRKNIMRKLGISNASELIMYAVKSGLIDNIEYHI